MLGEDSFKPWIADLSREEYTALAEQGLQLYDSIKETRDADLTSSRNNGGKIVTWHRLADEIFPFSNSTNYHGRVRALDETVDDYSSLFLAPCAAHCLPGKGHCPNNPHSQFNPCLAHSNSAHLGTPQGVYLRA
jgi:hypothetical protein